MDLVQVGDDRVDRPARGLAFDQHVEGLERRLDGGAGRPVLRLTQQRRSRLGGACGGAPRRLARRGFGRSRVSAVSSRIDSSSCLIGEVAAAAALEREYCGLSAVSGRSCSLRQRLAPGGDEIAACRGRAGPAPSVSYCAATAVCSPAAPSTQRSRFDLLGDVAESAEEGAVEARHR